MSESGNSITFNGKRSCMPEESCDQIPAERGSRRQRHAASQ
eukprot:COSAG01_NODE_45816_length_406_cov_0.534202_2_plen_40_part_01